MTRKSFQIHLSTAIVHVRSARRAGFSRLSDVACHHLSVFRPGTWVTDVRGHG
jgi:hypothetical protein